MNIKDKINEYGNVDIRKGVPSGLKYIKLDQISDRKVKNRLIKNGIDICPALIGFSDSRRRGWTPDLSGYVVSKEDYNKAIKVLKQIKILPAEGKELQLKKSIEKREAKEKQDAALFLIKIKERYPNMPDSDAEECAGWTTRIGSGCVGRSTTCNDPVRAAVVAYIRHNHTSYDDIISDFQRDLAREATKDDVYKILSQWGNNENK